MSTTEVLQALLNMGFIGVGGVCALVGGWTILAGRTPGWVWLAATPVNRYVRWWGAAAVSLGVGAMLVGIGWAQSSLLTAGAAVGFGLQVLAVGIWFYIRARAGFAHE